MIKIVVVDDELIIQKGIKLIIEQNFADTASVFLAGTAEECFDIVKELKPHIVISDICMPEIDGLKMLELLREYHPEIILIVISGFDDFDYCKKALSLNVMEYLLKPIAENELVEVIGKAVEKINPELAMEMNIRNQNKILKNIVEYIKRHYYESISLEILSKQFHYNSQYISQLFKKEMKTNLIDYLNLIRIEKSKILLKNGNIKMEEIAIKVGFSNPKYFSKIFKKNFGITPSDYKKQ